MINHVMLTHTHLITYDNMLTQLITLLYTYNYIQLLSWTNSAWSVDTQRFLKKFLLFQKLHTDNGGEFNNEIIDGLCKELQVEHVNGKHTDLRRKGR
jgi:hypothetical protein